VLLPEEKVNGVKDLVTAYIRKYAILVHLRGFQGVSPSYINSIWRRISPSIYNMASLQDKSNITIAIVGGGIGGLCAAIGLGRAGYHVHIFEQAHR
jgi:heterodisulfide reductase subunit A-like polyferredoxin